MMTFKTALRATMFAASALTLGACGDKLQIGQVEFALGLDEAGKLTATVSGASTVNMDPVSATSTGPVVTELPTHDLVEDHTHAEAVHYDSPRIRYALNGVRTHPVDHGIMSALDQILERLGPDVGLVVTSGGQPITGPDRTGSHRHDIDANGYGQAVDFHLTIGGNRVTPAQRPDLYEAVIEAAAKDHAGIGHYDWGLHVGHGAPAFWGPDLTSRSASPRFLSAYRRGRES